MSITHSRPISQEDASALSTETWKHAQIGDVHIRIHPLDSNGTITPAPHLNQTATIEILDSQGTCPEPASDESIEVLQRMFANVLA